MCNIRPEDRISAEELKTRIKLNGTRKCLQDTRYNGLQSRKNGRECLV